MAARKKPAPGETSGDDRRARGRTRPGAAFPVAPPKSELPAGYAAALADVKARVESERLRVVVAANAALVLLYWDIGRVILDRQATEGWGAKVIDRLSADLATAFPEMKGFSPRNLKYMRAFAEAWPEREFVQAALARITWYHNVALIERLADPEARRWYARAAADHGWSRNVLCAQIDRRARERQGKALTNFASTLPASTSDLAAEVFKDPYVFDFLGTGDPRRERDLEQGLVDHIQRFLLELGAGFAFVGRQVLLEVGDQDFRVDLLFYHLRLRCFVVVELKATEFRPEYAGKMNLYLSAVDDLMRHADDGPTIGLLLCKSRNALVVEYALRDVKKPIGVAEWETRLVESLPEGLRGSLPTVEEIEAELRTEPTPASRRSAAPPEEEAMTQGHRSQPRPSPFLRNGGRVVLVADAHERPALVASVARLFACFPGPLRVDVAPATASIPGTGRVTPEELFAAARNARRAAVIEPETFVALLTPRRNSDNWFSAVDESSPHDLFVQTTDWEWITRAPTECIVAHQILENVLEGALQACGVSIDDQMHEDTFGCINDFCENKIDVRMKLRTGDICDDCIGRLEAYGASPALLQQVVAILDACRRGSVATGRYAAAATDYARWPFPVAYTWHRAQGARDPQTEFLLLLDHFDALVRHMCIAGACRDGRTLDLPDAPSLGWWSRRLTSSAEGLDDVVALSDQRAVVDLRNELRAHGYVPHGAAPYADAAKTVRRALVAQHRMFDELESGWELRHVTGMSLVDVRYRVTGDRLVGSNVLSPGFEDELPAGVDAVAAGLTRTPAIVIRDAASGRYVDVSPYYRQTSCAECRHPRLLVIDGKPGAETTRYIDIVVGHRTLVPA